LEQLTKKKEKPMKAIALMLPCLSSLCTYTREIVFLLNSLSIRIQVQITKQKCEVELIAGCEQTNFNPKQ
jgi:hypothetical protein